ncbi:MAG: rod shape-determining protein MreD [Gammaproteobacteria bacterium]|nr:rod shape-determining protein MreD [Pseudomonadota bacterium]MCH9663098.1 rod shape-determining protein MreD [Gammaproteobacteria bacterium]
MNISRPEYTQQKLRLIIHLSVAVALLLSLYPFGPGYQIFAPDWLALTVLYWLARSEQSLSYWHIFFYGVAFDLLHFNFIGAESIGLLVFSYTFARYRTLFQFLPKIAQPAAVFLLLMIKQFCIQWMLGITGELPTWQIYLVPPLCGAIVWLAIDRLPTGNLPGRRRL